MNLAGVVPVAGQRLDYGVPWDDCMMPIAKDYLAVERAAVECLYAGCKSIWIVCEPKQQPLIRYRLGDRLKDPNSFNSFGPDRELDVCIYYVPVRATDHRMRNSIIWSLIYGVLNAKKITGRVSPYIVPEKFFVSFPFGVYQPYLTGRARKSLKDVRKQILLRYDGKTAADGEYLGFTLTVEDAEFLSKHLKQKAYDSSEKYAARNYALQDVLSSLELREGVVYVDLDEYYNISSWDQYVAYMATSQIELHRPKSLLLQKEWNGVGVDDE